MRTKTLFSAAALLVAAGVVVAACEKASHDITAPNGPRAFTNPWIDPGGNHTQDLDGTPDLVVDPGVLASSWVAREEDFVAGQCSVEEGNIPTGTHKTLRFSVLIMNKGTADLAVGDPKQHMDPNGDGDFSDQDGLFEFASCHKHFHFRNYARYEILPLLADGSLGTPVQARKRGFCMLDTTPANNGDGGAVEPYYYRLCGNLVYAGNQGISVNWGDMYEKNLPGQLFVLDDPAEPVPPGRYVLRVTANPPFTPKNGEVCPVQDAQGFCHMFAELSYDNNVGEVVVEIPDHPGRTGVGPGQGNFKESLDPAHHPEATGHDHQ